MVSRFAEHDVERAALASLESLRYAIAHGPDIAPGEPYAEREDFGRVVRSTAAGGPWRS
jgi:type I restriction enzyme R subunit